MKASIYYFSSTGNSLYVAREISKKLNQSSITPINYLTLNHPQHLENVIGFVFPVYFWGIPNMVRDFIRTLEIPEKAYIFSIATLGGSDYLSHQQISNILEEKGAYLSYYSSMLQPGNYQIMYPVPSQSRQDKMFSKAEFLISQIAQDVSQGIVKKVQTRSKLLSKGAEWFYKKMYSIPGGRDEHFISNEACIQCGLCKKICPADNIQLVDGKPRWKGHCQKCLGCYHWCPKNAIHYKNITQKRGQYHHPQIKLNDIIVIKDKTEKLV